MKQVKITNYLMQKLKAGQISEKVYIKTLKILQEYLKNGNMKCVPKVSKISLSNAQNFSAIIISNVERKK